MPATALTYPWKTLISGHLGRLGTRDDVALHQQYMADLEASANTARPPWIRHPTSQKYGAVGNMWGAVKAYLERGGRGDGRAGHREVHGRARGRGRVHPGGRVLADGVDATQPRDRPAGASLSAVEAPARPEPAIRDQLADHLLTPQNAALIVIDYQPSQFAAIRSIDQDLLTKNIVSTVKVAQLFGLPIVHSTVNVSTGLQQPTVQPLAELLSGYPPIDRTTINAWEDPNFVAAVRATGRRKLVMAALWTEMCLTFPTLDALREGFEVYPVTDAVGGTSARGTSGSHGAHRPGRCAAGDVGLARRRASTRLGSTGDGRGHR